METPDFTVPYTHHPAPPSVGQDTPDSCDNQSASGNFSESSGVLFFSGGTALKEAARVLARRVQTTHIITTFDSGGSTAALRRVIDIPAMGDIRSRILALANTSNQRVKNLVSVLEYRLPQSNAPVTAKDVFADFVQGSHPRMLCLDSEDYEWVKHRLMDVEARLSADFRHEDASIGNMVLVAGYFAHNHCLQPAAREMCDRVQARGAVHAVSEMPAQLAVRLESGETIIGQHRFTGKKGHFVQSPIADIWLVHDNAGTLVSASAEATALAAIARAQLVCYPIGSFFSSIAANLLVRGVGQAVAQAQCPKIFIPNPGADPELRGHTLVSQMEFLLRLLRADAPNEPAENLISHILVDTHNTHYSGDVPHAWLEQHNITLLDKPFVNPTDPPFIPGENLARVLEDFLG